MAENKYASLEQLQHYEKENTDYKICERLAAPEIAVIAIHGGGIEPGTTEIADKTAGDDYSFYSFVGIKKMNNFDLHLDSRVFIEPKCLAIVKEAVKVVSIHGCEIPEEGDIFLGGRDDVLKEKIEKNLTATGFSVGVTPERIAADYPSNICNRNRSRGGVQIEIEASLRARMFEGNYEKRADRANPTAVFDEFVAAIRAALTETN